MTHPLLAALLMLIPMQDFPTHSTQSPAALPTVSISLPAHIPSETVQIRYLMSGSFGGYSGYVEPKPGQTGYEIEASVGGEPAKSIKVLVYAPGCGFRTFESELARTSNSALRFFCESLPQIKIAGRIPSNLIRNEDTELNVRYIAFWGNRFFGILDGPVTEFQLATTRLDPDGSFLVDITDFSADKIASSYQEGSSLNLLLRDSKTLNLIAFNLSPEDAEYQSEIHRLRILPSYPSGIKFINSNK
jgi:hypothetical protein